MRRPMIETLTEVPPAVFSAILRARLDRTDRESRQNSPANDGRTGIIVDYISDPHWYNH